jgi:tetratricopeptide (TPR) repeat protein
MFVPGTLGRNPLVADGGRRGWRDGSSQWNVGRQLLDSIAPTPGSDARALLWYRAVAAYLFREGNLAELATHLRHGREVFPTSAEMLFDSACLHQELSSPAIQASIQALRASDVSVAVGTRASELQRAERFFREALAIAPAHVAARVRLGHTLGALGRHKEAAGELRTAIGGDLNPPLLYLAHLFVGSNEEALGRRAEARAHYEQAANMYPNAQSPRLALSGLARQTGDRARAQQSLAELAASSRLGIGDPWWNFYQPHNTDTDLLIAQMRSELSGWPGK